MENEIMNNVEVIEEVGEGIATDVNSGSGMGPVVKGVVGASIAIAAYNIGKIIWAKLKAKKEAEVADTCDAVIDDEVFDEE